MRARSSRRKSRIGNQAFALFAVRIANIGGSVPQKVGNFHARNRHRVLKREEQSQPRSLVRIERQQVGPVDFDFALRDLVFRMPGQSVGERALAGAVGPHQSVDFPRADFEIHAVQDGQILDRDVQIGNSQQMTHVGVWVRFKIFMFRSGPRRPHNRCGAAPASTIGVPLVIFWALILS